MGTLELADPGIESTNAGPGEFTGTAAVFADIQIQKLPDFFERETGRLRLPDETQTAQVFLPVASYAAILRRNPEQSFTLIETHGFDTYAARLGKFSD